MKKIFLLLLIFCTCAPKEEKINPTPFPFTESQVEEWATYEGNIILDGKESPIELKLKQGEVGLDSYFWLTIKLTTKDFSSMHSVRGKYAMLYGGPNNEVIVQIHSSIPIWGYTIEKGKMQQKPGPPMYHELNLNFMSEGGDKLVLLDRDRNRIAEDARYTIYRRLNLFTAEGYITFEKSRTDFFEKNTLEKWNVAPLGLYTQAKKNYDSIAKEKFEGVYLKALAYSVTSDSSDKENLVIKEILEMKRSTAFEKDTLK